MLIKITLILWMATKLLGILSPIDEGNIGGVSEHTDSSPPASLDENPAFQGWDLEVGDALSQNPWPSQAGVGQGSWTSQDELASGLDPQSLDPLSPGNPGGSFADPVGDLGIPSGNGSAGSPHDNSHFPLSANDDKLESSIGMVPVSENGLTMALLGLSLLGMGLYRQKML